jgi:hypothetical protein
MKRPINTIQAILFGAVLTIAISGLMPVVAQNADEFGDDYQGGNFGRVRFEERGLTIIRLTSGVDAGATVNAPIFPGESTLTSINQRAEIQLAAGTLVRIDYSTELAFLALPDPYAEITDNTVLQLTEGAIRLTAVLADGEEFRIDTPAATIYLLSDGDYRIEVESTGRTKVISRRGVAEVVGEAGSVLLRGGALTEIFPGSLPADPYPFNTFSSDSFDRWVDNRELSYQSADRLTGDYGQPGDVYQSLPVEIQPYYVELSLSGNWSYHNDYGYVWYPKHGPSGWRPYQDGSWAYGPNGYFWVSSEPWGWAPYHYGRWTMVPGYGWGWTPGRVFAGAWVNWSWGPLHVGWSPLGYWNDPIYYGSYSYGYYDPNCWVFVNYNHFHHYYPHHAVPVSAIGPGLSHHAVVTRPPRVSPRQLSADTASRSTAYTTARNNTAARVKPLATGTTRPARNFRQVESTLVQRGRTAGNTTAATVRTPSTTTSRPRVLTQTGQTTRSTVRDGSVASRPQRPATSGTVRPDRLTPSSGTRLKLPTPRTTERSKDRPTIYDRLAAPRTTKPRTGTSQPRTVPRPTTPTRKPVVVKPSPTTPRTPSSRPTARPGKRTVRPAAPSKPSTGPRKPPPKKDASIRSVKPKTAKPRTAPSRRAQPKSSKPRSTPRPSSGRKRR